MSNTKENETEVEAFYQICTVICASRGETAVGWKRETYTKTLELLKTYCEKALTHLTRELDKTEARDFTREFDKIVIEGNIAAQMVKV